MTAHWGLPDPAQAEGSEAERHLAFADALRMLSNRIGIFVSLPFDRLSKLSLQAKLLRFVQTGTIRRCRPSSTISEGRRCQLRQSRPRPCAVRAAPFEWSREDRIAEIRHQPSRSVALTSPGAPLMSHAKMISPAFFRRFLQS